MNSERDKMRRIVLGSILKEIVEKTTVNNQHSVLTSSQNGLVSQDEYFNKQIASQDNTGYKIIRKGQFTYRAMSDTGRFYINQSSYDIGIVSPAYPVFEITNTNIVLPEYIAMYFKSESFQNAIALQSTGSTRVSLKLNKIKDLEIFLPDVAQQREMLRNIAEAESLIQARREQLAKLAELVKSRFIELFGDLKTNPKGWPVLPFPAFAEIDGNMTTDYERYADYPHIGIDSIEKGTGELKGYRTVREDGVISGKYIFTPQHIIYSKIRPNLNKVALPAFEGLCSADAYPILPNRENCNRVFLAVAMRSEYYLEYILQFSSRTNLPKVNRKEIAGFRMPLPPLPLQEQFAAFVEQTDKSKLAIQESLAELETLKKALMQKYFG